jgi:rhodanese-related sulfurtransferase
MRQLLLLLGLALLPALATAWLHPKAPAWGELSTRPPELSVDAARALAAHERVLWIDARPAERFAQAHIPGALNLNEEHWEAGLPDFVAQWQPGMPVLVYCDALDCQASLHVARRLRQELGVDQVRLLSGGWRAWEEAKP